MTQLPPLNIVSCPKCGSHEGVDLAGPQRLCLECRHEWNPLDAPAPATAAPDEPEAWQYASQVLVTHTDDDDDNLQTNVYTWVTDEPHTEPDALDRARSMFAEACAETGDSRKVVAVELAGGYSRKVAPAEVEAGRPATEDTPDIAVAGDDTPDNVVALNDLQALVDRARARLVGTDVFVFGTERWATVERIDDDGTARVRFDDGTEADLLPDEFDDHPKFDGAVDIPDAIIEQLGATTLTLAALCLRAGVETLDVEGLGRPLRVPPTGWLPPDADLYPIIEQGAAYAIATLVHAFELPPEVVASIADQFDNDATKHQTEEGN